MRMHYAIAVALAALSAVTVGARTHDPLWVEKRRTGMKSSLGTIVDRCADPINSSTLTQGSDAGVDYYDFSKLTQGFTTDSYSWVYWYNGTNDCRSALKVDRNNYCDKGLSVTPGDNKLDVQWDGDNIRAAWRTQLCAWGGWEKGQDGAWNRVFDVYSMSRYALTVYVVGPKGVNPWADGKK